MTLSEMKERKKELGYSYEQIAELSGVPLSTVQKVFSGATQSPRYDTLYAIEKVLACLPPSMVREPASIYGKDISKKQGEYTIADYYAWPEDERVELIDGVIYYMSSPTIKHQRIISEIDFILKSFVKKKKKKKKEKCEVFGAGIDVRLDCDDKTMVIPDITVVCAKDKFTEQYLNGAPDLVVEVLSPSTRKKDMTIKLQKYANADVREYWIVDPKKEVIIVYNIENDMQVSFYTFESQIPVGIFNGECIVDFKEIKEYLEG